MGSGDKRICSNGLPPFFRLPVELQNKIFFRLPIISLSTCKLVCKSFCALIGDPDFQTSHSLLLQFEHKDEDSGNIDHTSHVLVSIDNTTKDVISHTSLTPKIRYDGMLFLIASCNGLVCFAVRTDERKSRDDMLLLWNPVTEQTKYIPIPTNIDGRKYHHEQTMEFYFVPETNDYNILSIGFIQHMPDSINVAVYRVSTNSWKVVDGIRLGRRFNCYEGHNNYRKREWATSVFLNGSFHWIFSSTDSSEIVFFDIEDEKLDLIRSIDHDWSFPEGIYNIGIIDESLALLYWSFFREDIEIEVMTHYDDDDSWVSKYKIDPKVWLQGCWENSVMISDGHSLYVYDTNDVEKMKKLISLPENLYLTGFSSFSLPWLQSAR